MHERIEIIIDPYVNADGLRIYKDSIRELNEMHEERLDAIKIAMRFLGALAEAEIDRRTANAAHS